MLQVYVPFWTECENMLSMVLGSGHRRELRNGAGNGGDMQDWENLLETCDQIDSSQLLLAIKEYEPHALVSLMRLHGQLEKPMLHICCKKAACL